VFCFHLFRCLAGVAMLAFVGFAAVSPAFQGCMEQVPSPLGTDCGPCALPTHEPGVSARPGVRFVLSGGCPFSLPDPWPTQ
jgi:hypothetical protein